MSVQASFNVRPPLTSNDSAHCRLGNSISRGNGFLTLSSKPRLSHVSHVALSDLACVVPRARYAASAAPSPVNPVLNVVPLRSVKNVGGVATSAVVARMPGHDRPSPMRQPEHNSMRGNGLATNLNIPVSAAVETTKPRPALIGFANAHFCPEPRGDLGGGGCIPAGARTIPSSPAPDFRWNDGEGRATLRAGRLDSHSMVLSSRAAPGLLPTAPGTFVPRILPKSSQRSQFSACLFELAAD